jgi:hypothetical protein
MAGFLNFLLKPKPDAPPVTIADLEQKLRELHETRDRSTTFLAGIEDRRAKLLLDDADPQKIIALDAEVDASRISLEKTEIFEGEILSRLSELHGDIAEQAWREAYDNMHSAAMKFAGKMSDCLQELYAYRAAAEGLNGFGYGMRRPGPAPVILGTESLQNWLRDLESDHDFELNRRERQAQ